MRKFLALLLSVVMLIGIVPATVFAAGVDYNHNASASTDEYYNLISKTDWDNAPGIVESEIVLNSDTGDDRQVVHIMKADVNNSYVSVIPTYAEMDTTKYQTSTMLDQANWIDENMEGEVIGVMNCCLSWYSGYDASRVGEPLGFMMLNGEIMFDPGNCGYEYGNVGFPTCIVINKDYNDAGEARPSDISKLEMVQIRTSADLDGWEDTVIPVSSGYIVKDGVNQNSVDHGNEAPRSVVGITADGQVVMMLNDGRQSPYSAGMSMYELAEVMIAAGCVWAANCDGGGSSTFVSQRPGEELQVVNSPSDGGLRPSTSGIGFISTAPADGQFARASIEADNQYYTPYSTVQFTAKGADIVGGSAEIPEDAYWQLAESSANLGSIDQNGLFTSNGAVGAVTAQLAYEGEVYGECTVNIVIPDSLVFSQSTLTVPNGESSSFSVTAMYGLIEVVSKSSDYSLALSSADMGTLDGCVLTATADETVTGGSIIATLTYDGSVTATMQVMFGKASEVIYDFENGFGDDWYVDQVQKRKTWSVTEKTSHYNILVDSCAVTADTGMVHDGVGAGAIYSDNTYATLNWGGASMYWAQETVTYENVSSIGAWIYIPKEAVAFDVRFVLTGVKDGEETSIDVFAHNFGDSLYFEESGWQYISVDVSAYDAIILKQAPAFEDVNNTNRYTGFRIALECQLNGGSSGEYNWVTTPGVKSINTFYIDNLTIDYSEACDDREEPIFSEVAYIEPISTEDQYLNNQRQTTTVTNYNSIGFSVAVADDTAKINASGLNAASAKAYIDGNEVACTFNGKNIAVEAQTLTNGVHTVKFTICDNAGNYTSVIRKINVEAENNDCSIKVVPKVEMDMAFTGSQYWVDLVATNAENVDKVTLTLDLNNVNYWLPEHIEALYGFDISYETDIAGENLLYLTITRTDAVEATGEAVLVSIPVQTWEWKEEDYPGYLPSAGGDNDLNGNSMYDPYEQWQEYVTTNMDIIVNPLEGLACYVDGTSEWFSGEKIQVDTEQKIGTWWSCSAANKVYFEGKSSWHLHVAGEALDKDATCTEAGYIGRVFCVGCACVTEEELGYVCDSHSGCGSVITWGETIPATGHNIVLIDGVYTCENCGEQGETANGLVKDGELYRYFIDGVAQSGWITIDTDHYYFHADTLAAKAGKRAVDGIEYEFEETGKLVSGVWAETLYGTRYYYGPSLCTTGWYTIDGNRYYFENTYRYEGYRMLFKAKVRRWYNFGDDGICREDEVINGFHWDSDKGLGYVVDNIGVDGLQKIDGDYYYFNYYGYAVSGFANVGSTYCDMPTGSYYFGEDYKAYTGLVEKDGVTYYYKNGRANMAGLIEIDGDYYFAGGAAGEILTGDNVNVWDGNGILPEARYDFDADGKMLQGIVEKDGTLYYYLNGKGRCAGLIEIDGDYYFAAGSNGELAVSKKTFVWEGNDLLPEATYEFGADGKMLQGIVEKDGTLYYYLNGQPKMAGLVEIDGDYYFAGGAKGEITVSKVTYVWKDNGIALDNANCEFGADGKMLNGIVDKDGTLYYYVMGRPKMAGLIEIDGDYYFAGGAKGEITVSKVAYVWKDNGIALDNANCEFGADGKMLNGIVDKDGTLYYYVMGRPKMAGLIEIDGDYYFAGGAKGEITVSKKAYVWKSNDLLPEATYEFGADGKMLQGIVEKDGVLYYYLNGQPKMAGLVECDGAYYFAYGTNGEVVVNKKAYVWKPNGLLPEGTYEFGADGKMLNGFITKDDGIYYYENGKPGRVGLNYIDGYYYFVDYSGKLFTSGTYFVWETNGYTIGMKYTFDAQGRLILG